MILGGTTGPYVGFFVWGGKLRTPLTGQAGFLVGRFCFHPYTHTQKVASKTFNCLEFPLKEDFFGQISQFSCDFGAV